jgi:hypothetical protein
LSTVDGVDGCPLSRRSSCGRGGRGRGSCAGATSAPRVSVAAGTQDRALPPSCYEPVIIITIATITIILDIRKTITITTVIIVTTATVIIITTITVIIITTTTIIIIIIIILIIIITIVTTTGL